MHWTRNERVAGLVAERGLSTTGFRKALQEYLREQFRDEYEEYAKNYRDNEGEEPETFEEHIQYMFDEFFPFSSFVVPAAYKIFINPDNDGWDNIHVYEVENSIETPSGKWRFYGTIADGDGPRITLHIIDKWDHEIIVENDELEVFSMLGIGGENPEFRKFFHDHTKQIRAHAVAQHHTVIDDSMKKEVQTLRRKMEHQTFDQITKIFDSVIYAIGTNTPQREIATKMGLSTATVRAASRLFKHREISPVAMVKDQQARWKAAYDAVRDLGFI